MGRTGCRSLTNKSYELFFNFLEGIQIIHKEHMSLARLAGNVHKLPVVSISEANGKDDEAYSVNNQNTETVGVFQILSFIKHMY